MSVYRENLAKVNDVDVGEMHVSVYLSNGEKYHDIKFRGTLEKSTELPNVFIITKAENKFNRWLVSAREGGFYTFDDPSRMTTDNGKTVMKFIIPFHAVVKLSTSTYRHIVEFVGGQVYDDYGHREAVVKLQNDHNRARWVEPPAKK